MEWRSTGARRSRGRVAQDTTSCDGCRAKPVSPCASVPDIGGAVVPLFTLSSRLPYGGSRPATISSSRVTSEVNSAWSATGGTPGMALPGTEAGGNRRRLRAHHRPRRSRAASALRGRSTGGEGGECCGFSAAGSSPGRPATTAARSCRTPCRRCPFCAPSSASRHAPSILDMVEMLGAARHRGVLRASRKGGSRDGRYRSELCRSGSDEPGTDWGARRADRISIRSSRAQLRRDRRFASRTAGARLVGPTTARRVPAQLSRMRHAVRGDGEPLPPPGE